MVKVAAGKAAGAFMDFAWAAHAEKALLDEQERHLQSCVRDQLSGLAGWKIGCFETEYVRLSIGPQDDTRRKRLAGCCRRPRPRRRAGWLVSFLFGTHMVDSLLSNVHSMRVPGAVGWRVLAAVHI